jgi:polyhydroxyalkanoate synthesis regulator phasin
MMNKKKLFGYVVTGALSLGILGGASLPAFAADTAAAPSTSAAVKHDKGKRIQNLDEATKAKVKAIFDQEKAGTITHEEAKTQLEALGLKAPADRPDPFANLDEATKVKAQAIFDQVKAGTLTKDEAKTQLEALGIKAPVGHPGDDQNSNDENTN